MDKDRCYTVKDLQIMLGISRPAVYDLIKKQRFNCYIIGGKYVISKRSFDRWFDAPKVNSDMQN